MRETAHNTKDAEAIKLFSVVSPEKKDEIISLVRDLLAAREQYPSRHH